MQAITDTGIRGFLKWWAQVQPGLYPHVAVAVTERVPAAFSDYHAGNWKIAGLGQADALQTLTFDPASIQPLPVDIPTAANDGAASSTLTDTIGNIVKGISTLYLTKKQADIQQQVVNTQLQRAALGLSPLPQSLANLGVPQVSVGLSTGTGTGIALIGGGLLLMMLFMRKSRR
jgi:hypothetical protein